MQPGHPQQAPRQRSSPPAAPRADAGASGRWWLSLRICDNSAGRASDRSAESWQTMRDIVWSVSEPHAPFRGSATRLIDREGECRLLDQLLAAVQDGESRALMLYGE